MSIVTELPLPSKWKKERLDWHFEKLKRVSHANEMPLSVFLGAGVVPRDSREDNHNKLGSDLSKYQLVEPGDLVFNRLRTWQGGFGAAGYRGIVSPAYIVCRPKRNVSSRFAHYLLLSSPYLAELTRVSKFMPPSQFDILWDDLKTLRLPLPPLPTQKAIANFLDRKTAAIDALIEKKEKLLKLLAEKRAALINQAVTKGLDPNVPMKDSGIPWIGEIPTHWEIVALRRVVSRIDQGWSPQAEDRITEQGEVGVLKLSAISDGSFYVNEHKTLPTDLKPRPEFYIQEGDLLVTRANTPKLVGATCLVDCGVPNLMLSDLIYRLKTKNSIRSDFLCFYLQSSSGRSPIESDARGSSQSMVKISQGHIKAWPIVLPPQNEQQEIAAMLYNFVSKSKENSYLVSLQIEKLREYRQALITAAVTGQLEIPAGDSLR